MDAVPHGEGRDGVGGGGGGGGVGEEAGWVERGGGVVGAEEEAGEEGEGEEQRAGGGGEPDHAGERRGHGVSGDRAGCGRGVVGWGRFVGSVYPVRPSQSRRQLQEEKKQKFSILSKPDGTLSNTKNIRNFRRIGYFICACIYNTKQ